MSNSLKDSVETLRQVTPRLNRATDKANQTVQAIEKFLNDECGLGMPAAVFGDDTDNGYVEIGYQRVGGRFRIAVREWTYIRDHDGEFVEDEDGEKRAKTSDWIAWSECGRTTKLLAFPKLPYLLEKLGASLKNIVACVNETAEAAAQILDALSAQDEVPGRAKPAAASKAPERRAENTQRATPP